MKRYRVLLERDQSGAWLARVPRIRGCHTHGRSIVEAKRRIREAVALWTNAPFELDFDVHLPGGVVAAVEESRATRTRAEIERERAARSTERAAIELVEGAGLGVRDAADVLGLSHQRVQQIVGMARSRGEVNRQ